MKIACESCGAKYSIADEKVAGKVFKIRCKRCSEVIVVKGDQQNAASAAQSSSAGEPIWHVVINGDQAGPYAPEQLAEMLTNGTVDWEAYVWAEGFDNWMPMRDVPDLVAQISGGGKRAQVEQRSSYEATPDAFTAQPSMGADPFAEDPTQIAGQYHAAAAEPDLFGGGGRAQAASLFDTGHVLASSPSPRVNVSADPSEAAMTGARNENSVLFSLKNLQSLATGSGPATNVPSAVGQAHAGYAGGEGSGLIDIRALASATGLSDADAREGAKDELLAIGTQGAFGALGSPMLAPAHDDDGGGKKMLIWAAVAGVGLLSLAAVAVAYIMRPANAPQPQPIGIQQQAPAVAAPTPAPEPEAKSEGERAAEENARQAANAVNEERGSDGKPRRKPSGSGASSSGSQTAEPSEPKPAVGDTKAPAKPSGPRSIDDLLANALDSKGGGTKAAAEAPKSNLPDLPSRDDVVNGMSSVKGAVAACAQGQTGVAFVNVSVAGATGRVTSAEVTGITGPAGSCIAKAVRGAQFPKFQQKVFKVKYPFKL